MGRRANGKARCHTLHESAWVAAEAKLFVWTGTRWRRFSARRSCILTPRTWLRADLMTGFDAWQHHIRAPKSSLLLMYLEGASYRIVSPFEICVLFSSFIKTEYKIKSINIKVIPSWTQLQSYAQNWLNEEALISCQSLMIWVINEQQRSS